MSVDVRDATAATGPLTVTPLAIVFVQTRAGDREGDRSVFATGGAGAPMANVMLVAPASRPVAATSVHVEFEEP
jgi:hypothetical protein